MPRCALSAGGPTRRSTGSEVLGAQQRGGCTGSCCSRDAVETTAFRARFRARRRIDGLALALADAPGAIGIAQPPKRMSVA